MKKVNEDAKYNAFIKFDGYYWQGSLWKDGSKITNVIQSIHKGDIIARLQTAHKQELEVTEWEEIEL